MKQIILIVWDVVRCQSVCPRQPLSTVGCAHMKAWDLDLRATQEGGMV